MLRRENSIRYPTALTEGVILAGRYVVGGVLGKGGFGITYSCYDLTGDKKVAVKEYLPDTLSHRNTGETAVLTYGGEKEEHFRNGAKKFFDEAKIVSRFNGNPNIISVYEFFYENNTAYFVMEFLDGIDFKHYISQSGGKISEGEALYIMERAADALMIVHSAGVLHRDISPDNIFICSDQNVKLIDFGAARQVLGEASKSLSVILKQGFAPIEQYQRRGKQGPWTDIYALGATLYYALTGRVIDDAMSRLENDALEMGDFSPQTMQILQKMLAVEAVNRYQSITEVKNDLSRLVTKREEPVVEEEWVTQHIRTVNDDESKARCVRCGKEIALGAMLCGDCEQELRRNKPKNKVKVKKKSNSNKKHNFIVPAILVCAALIIICILLVPNETNNNELENSVAEEATEKPFDYRDYEDIYDTVSFENNGMVAVTKNGKYGFIDTSGNLVIPTIYDYETHFSEDMAGVKKDGKWGYIDKEGNVVIGFTYDLAFEFHDGMGRVQNGGQWGYINKMGGIVIPLEYDGAIDFSENIAGVEKNGKWGYIDKTGTMLTAFDYDEVYDFKEGMGRAKKNGKWGYINAFGYVAVDFIYDEVRPFSQGVAEVKKDGKWGVVDMNGNEEF